MKILVLKGGRSNERAISLRSAKSVAKALKAAGHQVYEYDTLNGLSDLQQYVDAVDMVFPILHGLGGEDGSLQIVLEKLGFKYLGADSKVSRLCFDKLLFKQVARALDFLMPAEEVVDQKTFYQSKYLEKPFVLKPIKGGSSLDTFIVRHVDKLPPNIDKTLQRYGRMLLEELIEGVEITISVLNDKALPVIEIIPPKDGEFDYENKYNGQSQELCPPKNVSPVLQRQAQSMAEKLQNQLHIRHFCRTDCIVAKDGQIYLLETNTIPGLTEQSLFPKAAQKAGLSMKDLMSVFVGLVKQDN